MEFFKCFTFWSTAYFLFGVGVGVFQQRDDIVMGTDCALLLANLFLYLSDMDFIRVYIPMKRRNMLFNFSFKYIDILSFFQMHTFVIFWAYLSKWGWNEASSTLFKLFFHNSLIFSNNNSYSFRYRNTTEIPMLRLNIDWYALSSLYIYS